MSKKRQHEKYPLNLPGNLLRLWLVLCDESTDGRKALISRESLAGRLGISTVTLRRWLEKLETEELITRLSAPGEIKLHSWAQVKTKEIRKRRGQKDLQSVEAEILREEMESLRVAVEANTRGIVSEKKRKSSGASSSTVVPTTQSPLFGDQK